MKKSKVWILPVLVLALIIGYYFFGFELMKRMHPNQVAESLPELSAGITREIDAGKSSGTFYVSGISEEEIRAINDHIVSMNGDVDKYSIYEKTRGGMRVYFQYSISDNYYVCHKYLYDEEIPDDRLDAKALYTELKKVLDDIIKPGMSDYDKELAIHDYIVKHTSYGYVDSSKEYAYRAYGVLVQGKAVCNGYAEAMAMMLTCSGVENRIITGYADDELHAWNLVKLGEYWYQVDATWDDPQPDRENFAGHMYFNVTDDVMDDRHAWEKDDFPACTVLNENYFTRNHLVMSYTEFRENATTRFSRNVSEPAEYVLTDYEESSYDLSFLYGIQGVSSISYTSEPYGSHTLLTIYLNK